MWIEGDVSEKRGKLLKERAMLEFRDHFDETTNELLTDTLRIKKQGEGIRRTFNKDRFIEEKGEDKYNSFCDFEPKDPYLRPYRL